MEAQRVKIVDGGKLVIPAAMRRELGITTGDTVLVDVDDGELRVRSVLEHLNVLAPSCAGMCPKASAWLTS
jgi:AbrB family looped-hinge helix DNA binding protein